MGKFEDGKIYTATDDGVFSTDARGRLVGRPLDPIEEVDPQSAIVTGITQLGVDAPMSVVNPEISLVDKKELSAEDARDVKDVTEWADYMRKVSENQSNVRLHDMRLINKFIGIQNRLQSHLDLYTEYKRIMDSVISPLHPTGTLQPYDALIVIRRLLNQVDARDAAVVDAKTRVDLASGAGISKNDVVPKTQIIDTAGPKVPFWKKFFKK